MKFFSATPHDGRIWMSWPVMLVLAAASFAALHWAVPALFLRGNPGGNVFVPIVQALGIVMGAIFGALAAVAYVADRKERAEIAKNSPAEADETIAPEQTAEPSQADTPVKRELSAIDWDKTLVVPRSAVTRPTIWTRDVIDRMEWRRFELLVEAFFEGRGFATDVVERGPEGSVAARLIRSSDRALVAYLRAQPNGASVVGSEQVAEVIGAMAKVHAGRAIYMIAGRFDDDALAFAKEHPIQLLNGDMLMAKILQLPEKRRQELLALATEGEWTTPTCPACAAKMVRRTGAGLDFWACSNMPQCSATMAVAPAG